MNSTPEPKASTHRQLGFNRIAYGVFTLAGVIYVLMKDWNNAMIFLGLAPIFDPFPALPFKERPTWQKTWLYVHVTLTLFVLALLVREIFT